MKAVSHLRPVRKTPPHAQAKYLKSDSKHTFYTSKSKPKLMDVTLHIVQCKMSASTSSLWPTVGPQPPSIHEHLTLTVHTNQAIEAIDKKDKRPPVDILLTYLRALGDALVWVRDNQLEKEILWWRIIKNHPPSTEKVAMFNQLRNYPNNI